MIKTNWRTIVLYSTAAIIELCWLYVLLRLLNTQVVNDQLSIFGILLLYPLAFGFNKLIKLLPWKKIYLIIINCLTWAILMLATLKIQLYDNLEWTNLDWIFSLPLALPQLIYTFRPEILIFISSAIIWWLGRWLAYVTINFSTLLAKFQFGLIILIVTFFINSVLQVDIVNSIPVVLIFFFFSLMGISVAHAQENKSWLSSSNRLQWSWILLISIVLILILGLIISLILSHDLLQLAVDAIKWLGRLIMTILAFLASLLPRPEPTTMIPPVTGMPAMEPEDKTIIWNIPEALRSWLNIVMGVAWATLIVAALWQISTRLFNWLRGRFSMSDAEVEHIPGAFKADLISFLRHIIQKLSKFTLLSWLARKSEPFSPEALSVHQIYRLLLRWGAKAGHPRKIFQTPNEYFTTLVDLLPHARQDLSFITQHYVSTRYSPAVPDTMELQELRQSWDRVKQNRLKRPSS